MKAVIFTRVSSVGQEEGVSLDAQDQKLQDYCQDNHFDIIQTFRAVESSTRGERKKFYQALEFIKKEKETIALVVHSTDRLFRGFKEYGIIEELIEEEQLEIHVVNERLILNKETEWAKLLQFDFSILGAKMFIAQSKAHIKKVIAYKISKGEVIGRVPTGYLNYRDPITGKASVILDEGRAILIKRLFVSYASGIYSLRELTFKAEEWGLTNPKTGNALVHASICDVIKNPYYMGFMLYKGNLKPHVYPPIIDEALFNRCQALRESNRTKPIKASKKPFVFRGLMKCAQCGCSICSDIKKGKYIYLFCTKQKGKDICNSKRIREEVALEVVEEVLNSLVIPDSLLEEIRKYLIETNSNEKKDYKSVVEGFQKEFNKEEKKQERLFELYLSGSITAPKYDKTRLQIEKKIQQLSLLISSGRKDHKEFQDSLVLLLKVVSNAGKIFKSSKIEQKRKIIGFVFSNLYLDGQEVHYKLNRPFDKLVGLPKDKVWWRIPDSNRWPSQCH